MTAKIGSRYLAELTRLKHHISHVRAGLPQEDPQIIIQPVNQGTCYYDRCPNKVPKCNRKVSIIEDGGHASHYSLHSDCIEAILTDPRMPSLN